MSTEKKPEEKAPAPKHSSESKTSKSDEDESPTNIDYREVALELHDPEDIAFKNFPHAGVAEDDPGGVAEDDPAGSAPKDDNYGGSRAVKSKFVLDQEERTQKWNDKLSKEREEEAKAAKDGGKKKAVA